MIGLMIGARGTITECYIKFRNQFGLVSKCTDNFIVITLKVSYQLIQITCITKISNITVIQYEYLT